MPGKFRAQHVAETPAGWHVRTVESGGHEIRIAFPPGRRKKGSGKVVEVMHPAAENPCKMGNPSELVMLLNPREPRGWEPARCRTNPEEKTLEPEIQLFRDFQGREPEEIVEGHRSQLIRLNYMAIGPLFGLAPYVEGLKIPSPDHWDDGGYPVMDFRQSKIMLASNAVPDGKGGNVIGTQLYTIGGDQDISELLDLFPEEVDASKDLVNLGPLAYIVYHAHKGWDGDQWTEYMHKFNAPRPLLMFDQVKREMFLIGGRYAVEQPGIIN